MIVVHGYWWHHADAKVIALRYRRHVDRVGWLLLERLLPLRRCVHGSHRGKVRGDIVPAVLWSICRRKWIL
jgi:hypothetical protein